MINGIINIYKEKGFTSHDVVAKLRGIMKQKKIGHTGTLDPQATGVLPVCLGNATKLCDMMVEKEKEYVARVCLGVMTDTQDMTGTILEKREVSITKEQLEKVIEEFIGEYDQIPPMYSALKVNGKKLYELAREGKEIERKPRRVMIYEISLSEVDLPYFSIRVRCSKGTYIRTLCHDIGIRLGTLAAMEELTRTKSGQFTLETALTLAKVEELMKEYRESGSQEAPCFLLESDTFFADCEEVEIKTDYEKLIYNGNPFGEKCLKEEFRVREKKEQEKYRIYIGNHKFMGVYEYRKKEGKFYPFKMFLE